jgi:NAD+ synthase
MRRGSGGVLDGRALQLDCAAATRAITEFLVEAAVRRLHRRGLVVGISGGVDSAVCATLAAQALGPERVLGLLMPEHDASADGTRRARMLCEVIGIEPLVEDISSALHALGCYRHRDEAMRRLFPEYGPGYREKITTANPLSGDHLVPHFQLTVESPTGERQKKRVPLSVYLELVAATNMKQRTRKQIEYYHADRLNYAVLGTPNRLEYELGFFVRGGDGLADIKPIAHLYKSEVYALAAFLGVPEEIRVQPPTTDTYSLPQTQEEFYFALPYEQMDLLLLAFHNDVPPVEAGALLGLTAAQVQSVYRDIAAKRRVAARGLQHALLVEPVDISLDDP